MKMRHSLIRLIAVITLLGLFAWPTPAWACSCVPTPPPAQEFADRQAVFVGTVTGLSEPPFPILQQAANLWAQGTNSGVHGASSASSMPKVEFAVSDSWKGVTTTTATVAATRSSASCGIEFVWGQQYVVYAYDFDGSGLQTNMCTRTTDAANAAADLTFLNTQPKLALTPTGPSFWPMVIGVVLVVLLAGGGIYFTRRRAKASQAML